MAEGLSDECILDRHVTGGPIKQICIVCISKTISSLCSVIKRNVIIKAAAIVEITTREIEICNQSAFQITV